MQCHLAHRHNGSSHITRLHAAGVGAAATITTVNPFNGLFSRTTWVSHYQKGRTILDLTEARNDGVAVASAGLYANHLHFAPQITTPAPHHSIFFTSQLLFLPPNQHCRNYYYYKYYY